MTALKQSIDQAKASKKPMKKATAAEGESKSKAKRASKKTGS
jgi:hypothetical protein